MEGFSSDPSPSAYLAGDRLEMGANRMIERVDARDFRGVLISFECSFPTRNARVN
jgi:hypothetical protein